MRLKGERLRRLAGRPRPPLVALSSTVHPSHGTGSPHAHRQSRPQPASSAEQAPTGADLRMPPPLVLCSHLPH
ncbi:hypothetical protein BDA96_05G135700 [Sorghum bicolor]|uniref:Uncharacterized protein n=2 Tax=Sorghum bicolor TaxID=4558 RepID=A0A921QZQ6_SORBI|nr:hypothetical protein BDA96_05G135700 [Sorghum bicolor]KXG28437.1 hypothetical protein SORBI_3005G122900 [Sorghum bicolor]